jgi:trimeric autotransporter adhesin
MINTVWGQQNMKKKVSAILLSIVFLALMSSCGGGGGTGSAGGGAPAPPVSLVYIEVTAVEPVIALGTTTQLRATGIYSDKSKQDLTPSVEWHSSDDAVVTVSHGIAKSVRRGSAVIGAALGSVSGSISGSGTLTVTDATLVSIQVTPVNPAAALGTTRQFTATGIFSDNSVQNLTEQVDWSTSDGSVASVSNTAGSRGLATPAGIGATTVSATQDGVTGSMGFTVTEAVLVSIQVTPSNPSIPKGMTLQLSATGIYSDHSTQDLTGQVTWGASDPSVAAVSNAAGANGLAAALAVGPATVSAALDGVTGSTDFSVTEAILVSIQVTPTNPGLAKGTTLQLTATGTYSDHSAQDLTKQVTWGASDPSVASVSNADGFDGLATALAVGTTTVSAALGMVSGTAALEVTAATLVAIEVSPAAPSLAKGTTRQLTATGTYTDNSTQDLTKQVTWNVIDPSVASVSNAAGTNGLITALAVGSAAVSATLGSVSGTTTLNVTAAVLVSIVVDPHDAVTVIGVTRQFTASGVYSDSTVQALTQQVTWSSSTGTVATISNAAGSKGLATPVKVGSTTISATLGGVWGSTTLTVSNATLVSITVTPAGPSIQIGKTVQFTATGNYSNGMTLDVTKAATWKSSSSSVAKVSNAIADRGLATGVKKGTATITATLSSKSGTTKLTVL